MLHREQPGGDDVRPAQEVLTLGADVQECRRGPEDDPAIHAQTRVGRQEDLDRVVLVEGPLVDDVVQPTADQRRDRDDDHPVADEFGVLAGPARQPDDDEIGGGKADRVADPVPVDGDRPELDRDRIGREVEHPRKCNGAAPYTSRG